MNELQKKGYMKEEFRIFHIKDQKKAEFQYHSHDFHKVVFFISGNVTYYVEGKTYKLEPGDILLVGNTQIHKPQIDPNVVYERIVLWMYPDFLEKYSTPDTDLLCCFDYISQKKHLLKADSRNSISIMELLRRLEKAQQSTDYGHDIISKVLILQIMVLINIIYKKKSGSYQIGYDNRGMSKIINYINDNIQKELSIDSIASHFYMSRYSLMHKFKNETGSTVYDYIMRKRLVLAKTLIRQGMPIVRVSQECGFGDYSSFERAFKKNIGLTPRQYSSSLESEFMDI